MPEVNHDGPLVSKSMFGRSKTYHQGSGKIAWGEGLNVPVDKKAKKEAKKTTYTMNSPEKKRKSKKKGADGVRKDSIVSIDSF